MTKPVASNLNRVKELIKLINYHNDRYYGHDVPEISDAQFDEIFAELKGIED